MPRQLTQTQLEGIQKIIALRDGFVNGNGSHSYIDKHAKIDELVNIFCQYDLPDNNYMIIHLEANQYSNKQLFNDASLEKLLKHLTYIIWTDKLVDGYLSARVKDQTIYLILQRMAQLKASIFTLAPQEVG